jgi:hypothetical protein
MILIGLYSINLYKLKKYTHNINLINAVFSTKIILYD